MINQQSRASTPLVIIFSEGSQKRGRLEWNERDTAFCNQSCSNIDRDAIICVRQRCLRQHRNAQRSPSRGHDTRSNPFPSNKSSHSKPGRKEAKSTSAANKAHHARYDAFVEEPERVLAQLRRFSNCSTPTPSTTQNTRSDAQKRHWQRLDRSLEVMLSQPIEATRSRVTRLRSSRPARRGRRRALTTRCGSSSSAQRAAIRSRTRSASWTRRRWPTRRASTAWRSRARSSRSR